MTLFEAYQNWSAYLPEEKEDCCNIGHFHHASLKRWDPKPDHQVCKRELAWRRIVRIRDNEPTWPFHLRIIR